MTTTTKDRLGNPHLFDAHYRDNVREVFKEIRNRDADKREYQRQYYLANRERLLAKSKEYHRKKRAQKKSREYYLKNRETICAKQRERRARQTSIPFIDRVKLAVKILIKGK